MYQRLTSLFTLPLFLLLLLASCSPKEKQFTITGTIANAPEGTQLYLEHLTLEGSEILDSLQLPSSGKYKLHGALPTAPDFYRLRMGQQEVHFALNAETDRPQVESSYPAFAEQAKLTGTEDGGKIQQQWLRISEVRKSSSAARQGVAGDRQLTTEWLLLQDSLLMPYRDAARNAILADPSSTLAYFILFQLIDGQMPFNIYQQQGLQLLSAVANQWLARYPDASRTQHLKKLTLQAMASLRAERKRLELLKNLAERDDIAVASYVDFELPTQDGTLVRLSSVAAEHPVLLCFTMLAAPWAGELQEALLQRQQQEQSTGLRIIQVSFDQDPHLFESATKDLPWINLQDRNGLQSELIAHYNITTLPTIFFIDKNGEVMERLL